MLRVLSGFLIALALAGVGALPAGAESVLHRGNMNEPDTLDPQRATGSWESNVIGDMILGLMTDDPKGDPVYGAAESHTVSADGKVYTFTIREGHVWSDGVPVTADDFVYSYQRILAPTFAAEYASILYPIAGAQAYNSGEAGPEALQVRTIDPRTLEITLAHPASYFLQLLTHFSLFPVPKHVVETQGANWTSPGVMVSNGPYVLQEWQPNGFIRIARNPLFYDAENVSIDSVVFYPTDDSEAALKRFRAGELDINAGIPSQKIEFVRAELPEATRIAPFINTRYIAFNMSRAPFDDVRVREALSLAIDRGVIVEKILKAGERPAYALVPPGMAHYSSGAQLRFKDEPQEARIERAKVLLADAGFGPGNPLRFSYNVISDPDSRRVAVALASMWKAIGADAELLVSEKKVHYDTVRGGNYDVGEANWIADYNDAKNFLFLTQPSSGRMNIPRYADPRFEVLMEQADAEADATAREALLTEAEQLMLDAHAVAPLYFGVSRNLVQPYVTGWHDNVTGVHRTRYLSLTPGRD
ncbi:MAG: peptide ABC transporter substrate-binding protein [Alphaproteobacteria bacterium]|nr:peptide ABC transporter substrate-binding protein [Alphaproteobacteria bacterium]